MEAAPKSCPLCEQLTDTVLSRQLRRGTGIVYHCEPCDLGFLVADEFDAHARYDADYRKSVSHRAQPSATNPQEIFDTYSRYQDDRVKLVTQYKSSKSDVLEIGASAGQFLHRLENYQRRCAIELDRDCCRFMRDTLGIEASADVLRESRFWGQAFDLVCAFQVIEHTSDPVAFLSDIRTVMRPGAVAFIEAPNLNDHLLSVWDIPEYRDFYYHSDHRFYFTAKSLEAVARKAGFENVEIQFTQDYSLINTLNWISNKSPQPTCHPGLAPVMSIKKDDVLTAWLADALMRINDMYTGALVQRGATSNLMMRLTLP